MCASVAVGGGGENLASLTEILGCCCSKPPTETLLELLAPTKLKVSALGGIQRTGRPLGNPIGIVSAGRSAPCAESLT